MRVDVDQEDISDLFSQACSQLLGEEVKGDLVELNPEWHCVEQDQ